MKASIFQIAVFIFTILLELGLFAVIYGLIKLETQNKLNKLIFALLMGLTVTIGQVIMFTGVGVWFWIQSKDVRAFELLLPVVICLTPFVFLVSTSGTLVQLLYREGWKGFIRFASNSKKKTDG